MNQIRWLRILAGGFLAELAIFAVFLPATLLLGEKPGIYTAVVGSLIMPFLFGMWAHFPKLVGGGLGGYMVLMRKAAPIPTT